MGKHIVVGKSPLREIEQPQDVGPTEGGVATPEAAPKKGKNFCEVPSLCKATAPVISSPVRSADDEPTHQHRKSHCAHCDRHVFEVLTLEELDARARRGDCVTYLLNEKLPSSHSLLPTAASKMSRTEPQHRTKMVTGSWRLFILFLVLAVCAFVFHVLSPSVSNVLCPQPVACAVCDHVADGYDDEPMAPYASISE